MNHRSLGHRAPLLWVLVPFMFGLVAGKHQWLPFGPTAWAVAGIIAALAAVCVRRAWAPGVILAGLLSGAALYDVRRAHLAAWDELPPREARATIEIDRLFPQRPDRPGLSGLGRLLRTDTHLAELQCQPVYFSLALRRGEAPPARAGRLDLIGVLHPLPRTLPDDGFDAYLVNQGVNFKFTRARVTGVSGEAGVYRVFCDAALRRFHDILGAGIGEHGVETGVLRAMLLGQQQTLSDEQKDTYRRSGTMHLFSISGLHIAVIAAVITGALAVLRVPPVARFLVGSLLLWLYVDITGGTPSAVRAFLMVAFVHGSFVLRRAGNPVSALVCSAVLVLVLDPMQLFTASFQLSYGIVAAILLLGLPLAERWQERVPLFSTLPEVAWAWHHHARASAWRKTGEALALGLATTVVGMISGVAIFGLFTPVSLVANLALLPLGSLVIISGFVALVCGLLGLGWLVVVLNHASVLLLKVLDTGVRGFVAVPGGSHPAAFVHAWLGYAAFAGLLALVAYGYATDWRAKRGGFWVPFAFTALALGFGMRLVAVP